MSEGNEGNPQATSAYEAMFEDLLSEPAAPDEAASADEPTPEPPDAETGGEPGEAIDEGKPGEAVTGEAPTDEDEAADATADEDEEDDDPSFISLDLPQTCGIAQADALHSRLSRAEPEAMVLIDASEVEVVEAAILQLFYAFQEHAKTQGINLQWTGVSEQFESSCAVTGLAEHLILE